MEHLASVSEKPRAVKHLASIDFAP